MVTKRVWCGESVDASMNSGPDPSVMTKRSQATLLCDSRIMLACYSERGYGCGMLVARQGKSYTVYTTDDTLGH